MPLTRQFNRALASRGPAVGDSPLTAGRRAGMADWPGDLPAGSCGRCDIRGWESVPGQPVLADLGRCMAGWETSGEYGYGGPAPSWRQRRSAWNRWPCASQAARHRQRWIAEVAAGLTLSAFFPATGLARHRAAPRSPAEITPPASST
jgi:hypothetical protein